MQTGSSYLSLDLNSHRRKMLRFVWVIIGGLFLASFTLPLATGEMRVFPISIQLAFFGYLILCFVLSRIQIFYWITPHLLLSGMLLLFVTTCMLQYGINTPAAHFIPLIPALCSLMMKPRPTIIYGVIVCLSIAMLSVVDLNSGIRNASTLDLLNAATLILTTVVVTAGVVFIAKHNDNLISIFKGKSSYDELTGLPNRYFLRKNFDQKVSASRQNGAAMPGLMTIGIDGFFEFNREQGEQGGDMVLVQVAHAISSLLPNSENLILGRTQGNSFTLIFSDTEDDQLQYMSGKIQNGVEALNIQDGNKTPMTVSIAILKFTEQEDLSGTEALIKGHKSLLATQSKGSKQIASYEI